ncbi:MAG TPA: VacJ family lipoprotein [Burkholderiaceae bacterium]|nr:VacJ family lipoprotein [Burkholderiaceae bacterium]
MKPLLLRAAALTAALAIGASAQAAASDPLEGINRVVYRFNDGLDTVLLKPVAEGYRAVVPELARSGVNNVFGNIGDVWSALNSLLQGKGQTAATMAFRVGTNTLFGIGGLFDVASDLGLERQSEDFGQTLGRWGFGAGPYLVLPLLGPSSLRDAAALPLDMSAGVGAYTDDRRTTNSLSALQLVNTRANLLSAGRVLDDIALDKYVFIRDAYLSRRRNQVYDGDPPPLPEDKDDAPPARK